MDPKPRDMRSGEGAHFIASLPSNFPSLIQPIDPFTQFFIASDTPSIPFLYHL